MLYAEYDPAMRLSALQRWSAGGRDFALTMPLCQRMIQAEMNGSEVEYEQHPAIRDRFIEWHPSQNR